MTTGIRNFRLIINQIVPHLNNQIGALILSGQQSGYSLTNNQLYYKPAVLVSFAAFTFTSSIFIK